MTFSRSFKSQTWFVHMPGGSIEVMDGRLLERAFASCMLDGQTPVRASDSHMWSTLAEAGGLAAAEGLRGAARFDASSIQPMAWRVGTDIDSRKLDGRRGRTAVVLAVGVLAALVLVLGTDLASAFAQGESARPRIGCLLPMPSALVTNDAKPAHRSTARLSYEQSKRITEDDRWRDIGTEKMRVRQQFAKKSAAR